MSWGERQFKYTINVNDQIKKDAILERTDKDISEGKKKRTETREYDIKENEKYKM